MRTTTKKTIEVEQAITTCDVAGCHERVERDFACRCAMCGIDVCRKHERYFDEERLCRDCLKIGAPFREQAEAEERRHEEAIGAIRSAWKAACQKKKENGNG